MNGQYGFFKKELDQVVRDALCDEMDTVTRIAAFLDKEEQRCKRKIRSSDEGSLEQRIGQSRLHLIAQIRNIIKQSV